MKPLFILLIFLASGELGLCQGDSQNPYAEKLVTALVAGRGTLVVYSMQEKALNRLGDGAAIGLIRHVGAQIPTTSQEVQRMLSVIRMAFAAPEIIASDADREPKATVVLLSYLSFLPVSSSLKEQIKDTRTYVEHHLSDYKLKHARDKN